MKQWQKTLYYFLLAFGIYFLIDFVLLAAHQSETSKLNAVLLTAMIVISVMVVRMNRHGGLPE